MELKDNPDVKIKYHVSEGKYSARLFRFQGIGETKEEAIADLERSFKED